MEKRITISKKRQSGIDLLKITAMFFIVCVHIGGHGKAFSDSWFGVFQHSVFVLGVNCFALASGYILSATQYKIHRIMVYWLEVVFYSLLLMIYFYLCYPGVVHKTDLLHFFLPLYTDRYWYFSSYFLLYLFVPFYNRFLNSMSRKTTFRLIFLLVLLFCVLNVGKMKNRFHLIHGFSFWWLSVLYFIGAFLQKYIPVRKYRTVFLFLAYCVSVFLIWLSSVAQNNHRIYRFLNIGNFDYNNVTILLSSVFMMMLFVKIDIQKPVVQTIIARISTLTFGVYLIHDNPYVRTRLVINRFAWLSQLNLLQNTLQLLGISLVIFVFCLMVDYVRAFLFDVFKINFLCEKLCRFLSEKGNHLTDKITSRI